MNPWTALLESLHSALIDEFNERFPDDKPELGIPKRLSRFTPPEPDLDLVIHEVTQAAAVAGETSATSAAPAQRGFAMLAFDAAFARALGRAMDSARPEDLWIALVRRAGSEFMRRGIKPVVGPSQFLRVEGTLPAGLVEPTRVIWSPFRVAGGRCYLGIGV